jgi:hypothetical protein
MDSDNALTKNDKVTIVNSLLEYREKNRHRVTICYVIESNVFSMAVSERSKRRVKISENQNFKYIDCEHRKETTVWRFSTEKTTKFLIFDISTFFCFNLTTLFKSQQIDCLILFA